MCIGQAAINGIVLAQVCHERSSTVFTAWLCLVYGTPSAFNNPAPIAAAVICDQNVETVVRGDPVCAVLMYNRGHSVRTLLKNG